MSDDNGLVDDYHLFLKEQIEDTEVSEMGPGQGITQVAEDVATHKMNQAYRSCLLKLYQLFPRLKKHKAPVS